MNEWYKINEKIPPEQTMVLLWGKELRYPIQGTWPLQPYHLLIFGHADAVTHWSFTPEPPNE